MKPCNYVRFFLDWISLAVILTLVVVFVVWAANTHAQTPQDFQRQQAAQQAQHEALQRQAREDQARALREEQLRQTRELSPLRLPGR